MSNTGEPQAPGEYSRPQEIEDRLDEVVESGPTEADASQPPPRLPGEED